QPTVAPPARAEERLPDALAREQSSPREVDGPRFGAGAVTPAVPSPWVASEGVEGAPAAVEENPPEPRAADGQGGGCPGHARRAYAGARIGGVADDAGSGDESERAEHKAPGGWPCE